MAALRIGTRGSALALVQAGWVASALRAAGEPEPEIVAISTTGDRDSAGAGRPAGSAGVAADKSRFVREIDDALLAGSVDVAVHSAKDVPGEIPAGVAIGAVPAAEDPRDALCGAASLDALAPGARVGTSSLRRRAQLLAHRPDLEVAALAGNVDTRLRRLGEGAWDAVVLALAGLRRLGQEGQVGCALDPDEFVPAPGQGILALMGREDDRRAAGALRALEHAASRARLDAERAVVRRLGATCHTPVGAHARIDGGEIEVSCFAGLPDGSEWIGDRVTGPAGDPRGAGDALAERVLAAGAADLLRRAEHT